MLALSRGRMDDRPSECLRTAHAGDDESCLAGRMNERARLMTAVSGTRCGQRASKTATEMVSVTSEVSGCRCCCCCCCRCRVLEFCASAADFDTLILLRSRPSPRARHHPATGLPEGPRGNRSLGLAILPEVSGGCFTVYYDDQVMVHRWLMCKFPGLRTSTVPRWTTGEWSRRRRRQVLVV